MKISRPLFLSLILVTFLNRVLSAKEPFAKSTCKERKTKNGYCKLSIINVWQENLFPLPNNL